MKPGFMQGTNHKTAKNEQLHDIVNQPQRTENQTQTEMPFNPDEASRFVAYIQQPEREYTPVPQDTLEPLAVCSVAVIISTVAISRYVSKYSK